MAYRPALCGGLSLIHYNSFKAAASLPKLKQRYQEEMNKFLEWGIHVMVSQNGRGELTVAIHMNMVQRMTLLIKNLSTK